MLIGNYNQFVGYLEYTSGQDDSDVLKWSLIGAGGALLVILAVVTVFCIRRSRRSAGRVPNKQSADQEESRELSRIVRKVRRVPGPQGKGTDLRDEYLTPRSTEGRLVRRLQGSDSRRVDENLTNPGDTGYLSPVQYHQGAEVSSNIRHPVTDSPSQTGQMLPDGSNKQGVYIVPT